MQTARLRSALRKLEAVPFTDGDPYSPAAAPQEMLDFLAMLSGIKPVCLVGHGMDDPVWCSGVIDVAKGMGLRIEEGPFWKRDTPSFLPEWLVENSEAEDASKTAFYVCRTKKTRDEVAQINKTGGRLPADIEARLLGYPLCCVQAYHSRVMDHERLYRLLLERISGNDEKEMKRLVFDDVSMWPETADEIALATSAHRTHIIPFAAFCLLSSFTISVKT